MINMNNINLNLLPFFIAAAESKSLQEAGDKIGHSYSTVSTNISKLEEQFGVQLLTRKPLQLTDVGKNIYESVKNGLIDIYFAGVIADSKNNMEKGKVAIGCPSHILEFYLMNKIAKVVKDYPNFKIDLNTSYECEDLIEAVRQNKIDFALLDRIPNEYDNEKNLEIKEIKNSEYIFVSNKNIIINDITELNNYKYILSGEQRTNTIILAEILKNYNVELDTVLRCRFNRTENKCSKARHWNCLCFKRSCKKRFRK